LGGEAAAGGEAVSRTLFVLCLLLVLPAGAAEFHVAPDGTATGDGSRGRPWDLATALAQPAAVKPGDTLWLHGGTYRGTFTSTLAGTEAAPIVVRQAPGERAILDAGPSRETTLLVRGGDTWYWGFEVTNSHPERPYGPDGRTVRANGIYIYGPRTRFINLIVHDTGMGFGFWAPAVDAEIHGCLAYFNGYENRDHGIYVQNQSGTKRITDCILFANSGYGIHAYGSERAYLDNFHFEGNISFNNGGLYRPPFQGNIVLGGGRVARNATLLDNRFYFDLDAAKGLNDLGYGEGMEGGTIRGNTFVSGDRALRLKGSRVTMTGNTLYGQLVGSTAAEYPGNTYHAERPKGTWVSVRPNRYETGRAHIAVYNWDGQPSVEVDLSGRGLKSGDRFEIRDAQNYFGPPVLTGTYRGAPVSIPMTGTAIAAPVGTVAFPPRHSSPEFGAFVLVKTGGVDG